MKNKSFILLWIISMVFAASLTACQKGEKAEAETRKNDEEITMTKLQITSPSFNEGDVIPVEYTCDGSDISPELAWSEPPEATKSLVLICDDPDAPRGTWVHWVVINLPPSICGLAEAVNFADDSLLASAIECLTDFRDTGYGGPCPPPGPAHRYFFKLYALDISLELTENATKSEVEKAMNDHILAQGQLMGKYKR